MSKLIGTIREAIEKAGLKDGMTISFHHHMRNGDYVLNMVLAEAAAMGIRDLTVNASSIFDIHEPIIEHIKNGVVTQIECNYMGGKVGKAISQGIMEKPVIFRTHGGRAGDMENGSSKIDIAFLAAPCADDMGNLSGKYGPSACGSLGYAFSDAMYAKKVVAVTDRSGRHEPYCSHRLSPGCCKRSPGLLYLCFKQQRRRRGCKRVCGAAPEEKREPGRM